MGNAMFTIIRVDSNVAQDDMLAEQCVIERRHDVIVFPDTWQGNL